MPRAPRARGRFRGPVAVCAAILILAAAVLGGLVATGGIQLASHSTTVLAAAQAAPSANPAASADATSGVAQSPADATPAVALPSTSLAKPRAHAASTSSTP